MDYETYRQNYYVQPIPKGRFGFTGIHGITLYYQDYEAAADYYQRVLGPPAYVEGESTKGWQVGDTWLTLLRGVDGNPVNVELMIVMQNPGEADRLQRAFIEAGGSGPDPADTLMYEPVHVCPVTDPFGTDLMIYSPLEER
jgi:catechol 2,3-dioxygenase-like lactoylglutathione lyase family enzyme